jgi:hypothetical protein
MFQMRKTTLAIIISLALFAFFTGCDKLGLPKLNSKKDTKTTKKTTEKTSKTTSKTDQKSSTKETTTNNKTNKKPGTFESLSNYGTGATQLNIKRTKTQQIKDIQKNYNDKLKKAMR